MASHRHLPSPLRSLSARLLVLTAAFVLLAEVLIYVPSIARFRKVYLDERIAAAHLATLSLEAAGERGIDGALADELLSHAGVLSVTLREPAPELMLGKLPPVEKVLDLREGGARALIAEALETLRHRGARTIRVIGPSPQRPAVLVDISLREEALWNAMINYSWRILTLSIVISLITAAPGLRRAAARDGAAAAAHHREHHGVPRAPRGSRRRRCRRPGRSDEIGLVQTELSRMQEGLRTALAQKTRLAALGGAVSKINHDLRNLLANAMLLSDRLEQSQDPEVRHVAPRLVEAMDRAARLCAETLSFARAEVVRPRRSRFALAALLDEVGESLLGPDQANIRWRNEVRAEVMLYADRDQLFRVLVNLGRNAAQALAETGGLISVAAWQAGDATVIELADTGKGIPEAARAHLFEAFAGSTRPGGTGLGLPIAREIMRAHGGDVELAQTGPDGTVFRLTVPDR